MSEEYQNTVLFGDALDQLKTIPDETVQMCVTSPPYWGLRDYGHDGQLGLEETPEEYVDNMAKVFSEVRRVLKDDGTLWLNLGDSFAGTIRDKSLKKSDATWLAALIDGEGCIQIHRQKRKECADSFQLDVSVGMADKEMVEYAYRISGIGSLTKQNRGVWDWSVRGQQSADMLRVLYPFLLLKKRQAEIGIELCNHIKTKAFGRTNPVTHKAIKYRQKLKEACSSCNQRNDDGTIAPSPQITPTREIDLKPKDLCMIPARVAMALQADGWYLRSDIIWHKPNPMPESVKDRPTKAHEYVFLLSKSDKYFYDHDAIKEPLAESSLSRLSQDISSQNGSERANGGAKKNGKMKAVGSNDGRNKRSVWTVNTQPFSEAHFAVFPPALIAPCIKAGSKPYDIVLDPFFGSGTTGEVCKKLNRYYLGIELNQEYKPIQDKRLSQNTLQFN